MDKALQIGKSSTVGSFHLMIGIVVSTVILAVGTFILAAFLPVAELGLYGIIQIPSSMIAYFRDWGVNYALTRQIASLRVENKESEINNVIFSGFIFEIITGVALSIVSFGLAGPLAVILQRPEAASYIALMSISILASSIVSASTSIFVGFEKMKLNSFTQILQASIKTVLGASLVILGFGINGAVSAILVSFWVSAIVAVLIVYLLLFRPLHKNHAGSGKFWATLSPMLKYGFPLTVSSIAAGVLPQFFAFIMAIFAGDALMGNYYASTTFIVVLTFLTFPISTSLFPVFSKIDSQKEPELLRTVFASSVKYTALLLVPSTILVMTLSTPLVSTLFGDKFPFAPLFLSLTSAVNLYVVFGNVSLGTFQNGIGATRQVMKQSLLSLAIALPFSYFIISYLTSLCSGYTGQFYAIIGGIISILFSSVPGMVWGLIWIWRQYKTKADFKVSAKIVVASFFSAAVTLLFLSVFKWSSLVMLVLGAVIYLFIYLVSAPLVGAISRSDIDNLKAMLSGLGVISTIAGYLLSFMRKICKKPNSSSVN